MSAIASIVIAGYADIEVAMSPVEPSGVFQHPYESKGHVHFVMWELMRLEHAIKLIMLASCLSVPVFGGIFHWLTVREVRLRSLGRR